MIKAYLAHPISTTGEFNDSIRVAQRIEQLTKHAYVGDAKDAEVNGMVYDFEEGGAGVFADIPKFEVYAPALNKAINDKSNNPTPEMIYTQDVNNLLDADVVVINYTSGRAHGTILEIGMLAGMYEMYDVFKKNALELVKDNSFNKRFAEDAGSIEGVELDDKQMTQVKTSVLVKVLAEGWIELPTVFAYSSNKRMLQPQFWNGIASEGANHMVLGAIEKHFVWCENEDEMIYELSQL